MKICHITTAHSPDDIRIYHKQCRSLKKYYDNVIVLSLKSKNIPDSDVQFISPSNCGFGEKRGLKSLQIIINIAMKIDADIYQAHDPDLIPVLYMLKKRGKKVIFDFHEDVFEQIKAKPYINKYLRTPSAYIYRILERLMIRKFDGILTATETITSKYKHLKMPIETIHNYPLLNEFDKLIPDKNKANNILYIGGLSKERGTFDLIDLAKKRSNYNFIICGNFYNKHDEQKFIDLAPENILFKGYLNRAEIIDELKKAKIGILLLEDVERYKVSLPIKMFEYMAAYVPVIANDFKLWNDILGKNECGITVDKNNIQNILESIDEIILNDELALNMGEKGRNLVFNKLNWFEEEKKLINFYKKMED